LPARQNPSRDPPRAPDFARAIRRFPSRDPPISLTRSGAIRRFRARDPPISLTRSGASPGFRARDPPISLARSADFADFPPRDPTFSPLRAPLIPHLAADLSAATHNITCARPLSQPTILPRLAARGNTAARLRDSAIRRAAAIAQRRLRDDLAAARRRGRGGAGSSPRRKRDGAAVSPYRITVRRPCRAAGDESGRGAPGLPFGGRGGEAGAHGRDQRAAHA